MNNHFKMYNLSTFFRLLICPFMFLLFFEAAGQTTFTVTNKVMGGVGSFDVILASAIPSANAGNNVTIFFNVAPDATGNSLCTITSLLPDVSPTAGSILMTRAAGVTNKQGLEFADNLAFQKIFHAGGKLVRMSKLVIVKKNSVPYTSATIQFYYLKDEVDQSYAYLTSPELAFKFEEDYFDVNGILNYKITNLSTGTSQLGTVPKPTHTNKIKLNLGASPGIALSPGFMYLLEVKDVDGNKQFLKFKLISTELEYYNPG